MKTFNENKSDKDGVIKSVLVKNGEEIVVTLKDSKHILGSSQIQVEEQNGQSYGYSGDFGEGITDFIDVDTLVLDSTNGTRENLVNWTTADALKALSERVAEATSKHRKVGIVASPGLLQSTISHFEEIFNDVDFGTYEYSDRCDKSLVKAYSNVYSENGYSQPKVRSQIEAEKKGDFETQDMFRFSQKPLIILGHNYSQFPHPLPDEPNKFQGIIFNIKNFCRDNEKPIIQGSEAENVFHVSLTSHALGETILDYVSNVNPKYVITDSSRNQDCSKSLAEKIKAKLNIDAIPSSALQ